MIYDTIVIGAGLSGLVCASNLAKQSHNSSEQILILEAGNKIGGRTYSPDGIDLGAAWSWPHNDISLGKLIQSLSLDTISQDVPGSSIFEAADGTLKVISGESPSGNGSIRIDGGTNSISQRLVSQNSLDVMLDTRVTNVSVSSESTVVEVSTENYMQTSKSQFKARSVVVAMPPRQAACINYTPALGTKREKAFAATETWMSTAGKVCLLFDKENAFWKLRERNGTFSSVKGPVTQGWDNSDSNVASLCGFVFGKDLPKLEALKEQVQKCEQDTRLVQLEESGICPKKIDSPILDQLERIYGPEIWGFRAINCQSWSHLDEDCDLPQSRLQRPTEYGDPILSQVHADRVFFAGSETEPFQNGHMEGAVLSGIRVAKQVNQLLAAKP